MLSRSALIILFLASVVAAKDQSDVVRPAFKPTEITGHFVEQFTDDWEERWAYSEATKQSEVAGDKPEDVVFRFDGEWAVEEPVELAAIEGDKGLVLKSPAKHHALVAKFNEPLDNTGKTLVLQYEVKMQNPIECGGAYLKLLTHQEDGEFEASKFDDKTPYTIMFGPDKCGSTNKVHFIFRHKNPKTGEYEEKHMRTTPMARITKDSVLYTLIVNADNTYEVQINGDKVSTGNLLEDFDPPVNPAEEIPDPNDKKPADWVEEEKIEDPNATKPDDWDEEAPFQIPDPESKKPEDWLDNEPTTITDPDAEQPADWDAEEDGEWVAPSIPNPRCDEVSGCGQWKAPLVANPNYKGPWYPPMIDNPAYQGRWRPQSIPNPNYFEDKHPANFEKIDAVGFELWTMQGDILFDNIYIGHSVEDAKAFADETWKVKHEVETQLRKQDEPEPEPEADTGFDFVGQANAAIVQFRENFEAFYEHAQHDFVQAVTTFPLVVAGLLGIAVVGLLLSFSIISAVSGATAGSAPAAGKKPATADKSAADKAKVSDSEASASDLGGNDGDNESEGTKKSRRSRKKTRKVDN